VTFNAFEVLQHSNIGKDCLRIDVLNEAFLGTKKQLHTFNMLEKALNCFIP